MSPRLASALAVRRKAARLSQAELAEKVGVEVLSVGRWEAGQTLPVPLHLRRLCEVLEATPAELGFIQDPLDVLRLEGVERAVKRLRRDYSSTSPATLLPWVRQRLTQIEELQSNRLSPAQQRQLLTARGWLQLLLSALENDLGRREPAWEACDLALFLGREAGDRDLVSWAFETPSWFALWDGRARDALDYGEEGLRLAPEASAAWIMNKLKLAQARARMGDRLQAELQLFEARDELETWPLPEHPDDHFVFDPAKYAFYASAAYSWLELPELVEANAREVIRQSNDPSNHAWVPTRVSMARLDLAESLLLRGELEGALNEALQALGPFLRSNTLTRADRVEARLQERYPREPGVAEFSERLAAARGRLGSD